MNFVKSTAKAAFSSVASGIQFWLLLFGFAIMLCLILFGLKVLLEFLGLMQFYGSIIIAISILASSLILVTEFENYTHVIRTKG